MAELRILIVDDQEAIRRSLRSLLSSRPEWEVCSEAADGQAAIEKVQSLHPDLVLMDVTMPVMTGTEAAKAIRSQHANTKVIIISQNEPEVARRMAMEAGAAGYVAKSDLSRDLLSTIEKISQRLVSPQSATTAAPLLGTWDVNLHTNEAFWSPGLFSLLGYTPNDCTPSWEALLARVQPPDQLAVREQWTSAIADRRDYRFDFRILLPDGHTRSVEAKGRFYFDDTGRPYRDLGSLQDISAQRRNTEDSQDAAAGPKILEEKERKALEDRLTEAASQAELLDLVSDAALICDTAHRITYWNRAAERLYGWSSEDAVGKDVSDLLQTEYPVPFADLLAALEDHGRWEGELVHTNRYGMRVLVYSRWIHKRGERGEFKGWLEINADLTQQRQAEETARRLSGRILQLQDEERRKIARELHDSVGQYLAMLKITIDRGERQGTDASTRQLLNQCSQIVDQCISETRTVSYLLHPPLLDENGLLSAVRWYVEGFATRSGLEVQIEAPPAIPRLLKEIETTLFRILQESLTNVHRHSQSKKVHIEVACDTYTVSLRVRDFGKGIPLDRIRSFRDRGSGMGIGLGGMRERVRELGGVLRIEPAKPSGTVIVVVIPLIEGQKRLLPSHAAETSAQNAASGMAASGS
jgi:PAS domain S-box-containing protein